MKAEKHFKEIREDGIRIVGNIRNTKLPDIDLHDALWLNWHDHFEKKLAESEAKIKSLKEQLISKVEELDKQSNSWVKKLSESKANNRELIERYNAVMKSAGEVGTMYLNQSQKFAEKDKQRIQEHNDRELYWAGLMMEKDKEITALNVAGKIACDEIKRLMMEKDKEITEVVKAGENNVNAQAQLMLSEKDAHIWQLKMRIKILEGDCIQPEHTKDFWKAEAGRLKKEKLDFENSFKMEPDHDIKCPVCFKAGQQQVLSDLVRKIEKLNVQTVLIDEFGYPIFIPNVPNSVAIRKKVLELLEEKP